MIVRSYAIELQIYHDEICGRICFTREDGTREESSLYSLPELQMIRKAWAAGLLLGSFAIGATLAETADCTIVQKGQ